MNRALVPAVLALMLAAPAVLAEPTAAGGPANPEVQRIREFREAGERKLVAGKFTRRTLMLKAAGAREDLAQRWSKLDAYYEGGTLVRLQLYPHAAISGRTEEFYVLGGHVVFAYIQDKGPKHEGRDAGEPGKEFYFDGDRLVHMEDRSGEPVRNAEGEKRMYEATLPYEVSELVWLLDHHK